MGLYLQHKEIPFKVGDTVKIHQVIRESGKERIQIFEGLVIKARGHEGEKSFTVRKISSGIGVERIWQLDSPLIQSVEVTHKGNPNRAKLYYLKKRTGRLALKVKSASGTKEGNGFSKPVNQEVIQSTDALEKDIKSESAEPKTAKPKQTRKTGGKQSEKVSSK